MQPAYLTRHAATHRRFSPAAFLAAVAVVFSACTSAPVRPRITPEEQAKVDQNLGIQLARDLEAELTIRKDAEVLVYLRDLAGRIAKKRRELRDAPLGVLLVANSDSRWRCFSLPGNRIYLSVGLLKAVDYESELAAAIAFELAHILNRHVIDRLSQLDPASGNDLSTLRQPGRQESDQPIFSPQFPASVEYFGPRGILSFSEAEFESSADLAVELLYRAGYDPRGLTALWKRFERNPERSPYDARTLDRLLDRTRDAIAMHTPLRNPIVRSDAFLLIQKRFHLL